MSALTKEEARIAALLLGIPLYHIEGPDGRRVWYREATLDERRQLVPDQEVIVAFAPKVSIIERRFGYVWKPTRVNTYIVQKVVGQGAVHIIGHDVTVHTEHDYERIVMEI